MLIKFNCELSKLDYTQKKWEFEGKMNELALVNFNLEFCNKRKKIACNGIFQINNR